MGSQAGWLTDTVRVASQVLLLFALTGAAVAQVPDKINYQGRLTDPGGTPITASVPMVFKLYTVSSGGAAIYTDTQTVSVANGIFNVAIGSVTPLNLPFDVPYYLGVKVGADAEMTPRQAVLTAAYAQRADMANALTTGGTAGQVLVGTGAVPAWSDSLSLNGNLTLVNPSTASTGNILKGGNRFIHNFGSGNTFIGENSGNFTMTGVENTATGANALAANTTGFRNAGNGFQALAGNQTGSYNTASGAYALESNTTGIQNTAAGAFALRLSNTDDNTGLGYQALYNNAGVSNTAIGSQALANNTTGNFNTATGYTALYLNNSGTYNTAIGSKALTNNTTGSQNSAYGYQALVSNTTGYDNSAYGVRALSGNTTGYVNVAFGSDALTANTTGKLNSAFGVEALLSNTDGDFNVAVGASALVHIHGHSNIGIGVGAGGNNSLGDNNIYIGNLADHGSESATIRIGPDADQGVPNPRAFINGIRGITTSLTDGVVVLIDSQGQLGTINSSRRSKEDITDMDEASGALMQLRPVTFHYRSDQNPAARRLQYGLIAEEVAEIYPELVTHMRDGEVETVMYQFLPPMLLNEFQKQQRTIAAQATEIAMLKRDRDLQAARLDALELQATALAALQHQVEQLTRAQSRGTGVLALDAQTGTR
jgi:hypothetical protein